MSNANTKQVGGDHYKTGGIEHWDWVAAANLGYFEGCASKYIARHAKKNGRVDVQKARHFVEKLLELHQNARVTSQMNRAARFGLTGTFTEAAGLGAEESRACFLLATWRDQADLLDVLAILDRLLEAYPQ